MFIKLDKEAADDMSHLEKVFSNELLLKDNFQGEMLRTLLKRVIIKTTRIAKQLSKNSNQFPDEKMDLIRKFSLLVEVTFKTEHEVRFSAAPLNKSLNTLKIELAA